MIECTYKAILLSAKDYKENDRLLRLLTAERGVITALMKGAKKPSAKLRFGAVQFAFCEYSLCQRGAFPVVTGCCQIEDLFSIADDYDTFVAASIMLEVADSATGNEANPVLFILLLKSLKLLLFDNINPYLIAIRFIQKTIHDLGYAYEYPSPPDKICTVMGLLSFLNSVEIAAFDFVSNNNETNLHNGISKDLIMKTLTKIIANFEKKFEVYIKSKRLISA